MQQHCIGINGCFFNTHRMLGQYFNNAYFPNVSEEEAVPEMANILAHGRERTRERATAKVR
jgi:hypothetical protein